MHDSPAVGVVSAAVQSAFPAGDHAAIRAALDLYGEPHEPERDRVRLAIVELSGGDKHKLVELVQAAKLDYRDVLAWKQLGPLPAAEGAKLQDEARALLEKWRSK